MGHPLASSRAVPKTLLRWIRAYTLAGLKLFVSRGLEALGTDAGKQGYVCFGQRTPGDTAEAIGTLAGMGLAPAEIVPDFNRYDGAQVLAGVSQMIRTVAAPRSESVVRGFYRGPLYTADRVSGPPKQ